MKDANDNRKDISSSLKEKMEEALRQENQRLRFELEELKLKLGLKEVSSTSSSSSSSSSFVDSSSQASFHNSHGLSKIEIERFSRQLLIPDIGVLGKDYA